MADNLGANITLKLALEKAAAAESRATVQGLGKDFDATANKADSAGKSADAAVTALASKTDDATASVKTLDSALDKASQTAEKLQKSSSGGFGVEGLRRTGGALTQLGLGDIGQPIQRIGDLGQVIKEAGAISEAANVSITGTTVAVGGLEVALAPLLVTVGLVGAAVVSLVLIFKQIEDQSKKSAEALKADYDEKQRQVEQDAANRQLARSTTAAQNQQDIDDLAKKITDYGKLLSDLRDKRAAVEQAYSDLGASFNPAARSSLGSQGQELDKEIAATRAELDTLNATFQNSTLTLPTLIKQETEHAAALKAQSDAEQAFVDEQDKSAQRTVENAKLARTATEAQIRDMLQGISDQVRAKSDELLTLETGEKSEASAKRIAELKTELSDLAKQSYDLGTTILPLAKANDAEAEAAKKATKAAADHAKQNDALASSYKKNADDQAKIAADGAETRKAIDSKLTDDLAKIEQDGIIRRAAIAQQYSDKLIDIANSAADAAADTLRGLDQKYADNALALQRNSADLVTKGKQDQLKIEIDAQRTETQNAIDHARALEDIRNRSRSGDLKLLRDRNFLGLLNSRESEAGDLNSENTRYGRQQQDAQRATQEKQQDAQLALNQERQQRLLAYQRANQDAKTAADRQLAQQQLNEKRQIDAAKVARDRAYRDQVADEQRAITAARQANAQQLRDLNEKIIRERNTRYEGYKNELRLLQQTEAQRASIITAYAAQARNALGQPARGGQGGSSAGVGFHAAGGGKIIVNDGGQQEGFNGVPFPPVLGSFTPFRSGTINPSVGGATTNIFNIRAHDTDGVRREVVNVLKQVQGVR